MAKQILGERGYRSAPPVSDHCPLLLNTDRPKTGPSPFRFENIWLRHSSFEQNIKSWWGEKATEKWGALNIQGKLKNLKEKLKCWNRIVFGNVRLKKGDSVQFN